MPIRSVSAVVLLLLFVAAGLPAQSRFFPVDDLKPGMVATGRTVFEVIVEDVTASPYFGGGALPVMLAAGIHSLQSTPLFDRSGEFVGMLSTHWRAHHRPSERELRFLDLLARQSADLIDSKRTENALRESEERLHALVTASSNVVYRMSPDWSEMWHLEGREFIPDTAGPSQGVARKIHPADGPGAGSGRDPGRYP